MQAPSAEVEDEDEGLVPTGDDPRPLRTDLDEEDDAIRNANGRRPLRAVPVEEDEE